MKKIFALISVAMLALGFTACYNDTEAFEGGKAKQVKLNITVGNLNDEASSRAIKTGWENGDKLNIWFDEVTITSTVPDLTLTYDGSEWTAGTLNKTPNASGSLYVLYEGYNDLSQYTAISNGLRPTYQMVNDKLTFAQPIAYTNLSAISYTYESNTLTANLNSWMSLTKYQVVVTGLDPAQASNYALKETELTNGYVAFFSSRFQATNTGEGNYVLGVNNTDGVAFYFFGQRSGGAAKDWTFTLKDIAAGTEKTYTKESTSLNSGMSSVKGIKIAASKFQ